MDIKKVTAAIEADAGQKLPGLEQSLKEMKAGQHGRVHTPQQILMRESRRSIGYTQPRFAKLLSTSVGTLRDWEQGRFEPAGSAVKLANMIHRHPELIEEIEAIRA